MKIRVASLLIATALTGCAQAQDPLGPPSAVEVVDGRTDGGAGEAGRDISGWEASVPVRQAVAAARIYWQGRDPSYEEDVRVLAITDGAFTRPEVEEQAVLYLMSLWPRCCPKMGLAVLEEDRLVRNVAFERVAQGLWAVSDLDGDGRDELVFDGTFGMGGQWSRSVTLAAFGDDALYDRVSVAVLDDACAAGHAGSTAARVSALPGPEFLVERYTRASCETETWEPAGDPEPLALDALSDNPYVDLPVE